MKIVVCMKQVPATSKVDIDPETGAMKRMSGETRTNPYDLFALETALAIREKTGGTVTVLTMGPPQAEEMIRDAYTMGADEGVILSDRKFAGADVLATSYALAQGIQVIGGADLIICGRQTTDGDTAQVGPAIAEHLTIPHAAWVAEIMDVNEKSIQVRQDLVSVSQVSEIPYPCLLTIDKDTCVPRLPSYLLKKEKLCLGAGRIPHGHPHICRLVYRCKMYERVQSEYAGSGSEPLRTDRFPHLCGKNVCAGGK